MVRWAASYIDQKRALKHPITYHVNWKDGNRSNLDFDTASFFDVGRRDDTQHGGKNRGNSKKSMFQMFLWLLPKRAKIIH